MIANSDGQKLFDHCRAVGIVARELAKHVTKNINNQEVKEKIIDQCTLAGYLHDTGKASKAFQKFLTKKQKAVIPLDEQEEEAEPQFYHNQISWAALTSLGSSFEQNNGVAAYAIYHHHTHTRNGSEPDDSFIDNEVWAFTKDMHNACLSDFGEMKSFPKRNNTKITTKHPVSLITVICLIQADRWISEMGASLSSIDLEGKFCPQLQSYLASTTRLKSSTKQKDKLYDYQAKVVSELRASNKNTFIVEAQAGAGKTAMAIEFCESFNRKTDLFVAPRNTICHSLFDTINDDLNMLDISNRTIELITASERQRCSQNNNEAVAQSSIVIINIDSVLGAYFNHAKINNLINFLTSPMVIDEFHELCQESAILSVSRSLIAARDFLGSKTLLISATPVNILSDLEVFVDSNNRHPISVEDIKADYPTQLDSKHHFAIVKALPHVLDDGTWLRLNTISGVQNAFLSNDRAGLILHSKFCKEDREEKFALCNAMYGKNATEKRMNVYSSPVAECSLNNSYDHAVLELSTPMSLLQSLGRVRRFKEQASQVFDSTVKILVPELNSSTSAYIRIVYNVPLYEKWCAYVKQNFDNKLLSKSEVLKLVVDFNKENEKETDDWIKNLITKSDENVSKVKHKSSSSKKDKKEILADGTLRGNAGVYGVFCMNDIEKYFAFSDKDIRYVFESLQKNPDFKGHTRYLEKLSTINKKYAVNKKLSKLSAFDLQKRARNKSTPLVMSADNFPAWCFSYDDELVIAKNVGIQKISAVGSSAEIIDDEL